MSFQRRVRWCGCCFFETFDSASHTHRGDKKNSFISFFSSLLFTLNKTLACFIWTFNRMSLIAFPETIKNLNVTNFIQLTIIVFAVNVFAVNTLRVFFLCTYQFLVFHFFLYLQTFASITLYTKRVNFNKKNNHDTFPFFVYILFYFIQFWCFSTLVFADVNFKFFTHITTNSKLTNCFASCNLSNKVKRRLKSGWKSVSERKRKRSAEGKKQKKNHKHWSVIIQNKQNARKTQKIHNYLLNVLVKRIKYSIKRWMTGKK